jgi:hypothetical protein
MGVIDKLHRLNLRFHQPDASIGDRASESPSEADREREEGPSNGRTEEEQACRKNLTNFNHRRGK